MKSERVPTIGETVLYVPHPVSPAAQRGNEILPALITRVYDDPTYLNTEVNLRIIADGPSTDDFFKPATIYDKDKGPNTWHFIGD